MENNNFYGFEDILRALGYDNFTESNASTEKDNKKDKTTSDGNKQKNDEFYKNFNCNDVLGGFQNVYPELFVVVGEIMGNILSGKLPINVQNSFGNWLQLVGQVILTYNAQQQYFQGGPGRYFNPKFYNVSNPFCTNFNMTTGGNQFNSNNKSSTKTKGRKELTRDIDELKDSINQLKMDIESFKNQSMDMSE